MVLEMHWMLMSPMIGDKLFCMTITAYRYILKSEQVNLTKFEMHLKHDTMSCSTLQPRPSCSKLTMSLVNDSLKFTSSDTQIF